jgi:hypothetical protein
VRVRGCIRRAILGGHIESDKSLEEVILHGSYKG